MYPKSKSPLESKYERLRGMCSGVGENVRYIPIGNGIQQHGRAWRHMVGAVCISAYKQHGDRGTRYTVGVGRHSRKEARYTNATSGILVYDMRTQYTTVITRASQRPGACIACACVRALYYYIIILLYYYIYIYPIYPVYPVYLIYPIYPTMVI